MATAPTIVSTGLMPVAGWGNTSNPVPTTNISAQAGDRILIIAARADSAGTTWVVSTTGGLTWANAGSNYATDRCAVAVFTTTVASNGTYGVGLSCGTSIPQAARYWVMRGSDGFGTPVFNTASPHTESITTTADASSIVGLMADWNALNTTTAWTNIGSSTKTVHDASVLVVGQYTIDSASFTDVGVAGVKTLANDGSTNYGTLVGIEVKGSASTPTPVTSTKASAWSTQSKVTDTAASAWSTRALITDTAASAWTIRTPFTGTAATAWSVRSLVQQTKASAWSLRSQVQQSKAAAWNVLSQAISVTSSKASAWSARAQVAQSKAAAWNVLASSLPVTSTKAAAWSVRAVITDTVSSAWSVRARITDTTSAAWSVRARTSSTQPAAWNVKVPLTSTRAMSWALRVLLTATKSTAWSAGGRVTGTATSGWDVHIERGLMFTPPPHQDTFLVRDLTSHGVHHLFDRLARPHGVTVLKTNGTYRQVEGPTDEELAAADVAYLGGRTYTVTRAEGAELTAAGYGAWVMDPGGA